MPPTNPGKGTRKTRELRNTEEGDEWLFDQDTATHSPTPKLRTPGPRSSRQSNMEAERIHGVEKTMAAAMGKLNQVLLRIERLDAAAQASGSVNASGQPKQQPSAGGAVSLTGMHMPKKLFSPSESNAEDSAARGARIASVGGSEVGGGDDLGGGGGGGEDEAVSENGDEEITHLVKEESDDWMINPTKKCERPQPPNPNPSLCVEPRI